jgi:hypothetical protein
MPPSNEPSNINPANDEQERFEQQPAPSLPQTFSPQASSPSASPAEVPPTEPVTSSTPPAPIQAPTAEATSAPVAEPGSQAFNTSPVSSNQAEQSQQPSPVTQPGMAAPAPTIQPAPNAVVSGAPIAPTNGAPYQLSTPMSSSAFNDGSKKKRLPLILAAVGAIVLLIGGSAGAWALTHKETPDSVFTGMLNTSLSTKSVEQSIKDAANTGSGTVDIYAEDVKHPITAIQAEVTSDEVAVSFNSYSSLDNTYVKFNKFNAGQTVPESTFSGIVNKWIQFKKDGQTEHSSILDSFGDVFSSQYNFFGEAIFGNFSANDRKSLVDFAKTNQIYKYDASKVTKEKLDGKAVYVYAVTLNQDKLLEYNKKVAQIIGLKESDIQQALDDIGKSTGGKLYVEIGSKHLVKVESTTSDGKPATNTYQKYDAVPPQSEPTADVQGNQFDQYFRDSIQRSLTR